MIKAYLFDMDGVLIDSEVIYLNSLVKCLHSLHIEEERNALAFLVGMKIEDITKRLIERYSIDSLTVEQLIELQNKFFDDEVDQEELVCMDGLVPFLKALKENNKKVALVSSSDLSWITKVIDTLHLRQYFDMIVSGEHVNLSKPNPDIFLYAASKLHISCKECVVIEDSVNGITAGKAAGMYVIGYKGSNIIQDTSQADIEVHRFSDIKIY